VIGARLDGFRRAVGAALERGRPAGVLTRSIATFVAPLHLRPRPVRASPAVRIICVGGATLGGSGKSRLANAIAHASGAIVIGHGYRAEDRRARFVEPDETVANAGDEALVAARAGLRVVIGPSRQEAIDFAARHGDLLVLDGPLSVTHRRSVSVLAVDADEPWGSGEVFPAGDLRAPPAELERRADFVVRVPSTVDPEILKNLERPLGLFTALARPERLIRQLRPDVVVSAPDHGPADPCRLVTMRRGVTQWVATAKCATHLGPDRDAFPLRILGDTYTARLDRELVGRIVSSIDCERAGREDTRHDHRSKTGG
jgi:tetraacyldisaccharide 4'-kinase